MDTMEALAAAVAVYRHNGNSYIKQNEQIFNLNTGSSETAKFSNKELLKSHFNHDYYSSNTPESMKPPVIAVTEEDKKVAEDIRNFTKKLLFKAMAVASSKDYPPYDVMVFQKVNQTEVAMNELGIIASAPLYYFKEQKKIAIEQIITDSQHVGSIGGKVFLTDAEVIKSIYSNNYNTNIVQVICEGNLFFFFSSATVKEGEIVTLSGKIKKHVLEKEKYPMTKLGYVHIKGKEHETTPNFL